MAITYPLTPPTDVMDFAAVTWRRVQPQNITISPFSGIQQVQDSTVGYWEASLTLPPMTRAQADAWQAFVLALDGAKGTFLLGDPERGTVRGVGGGNPAVNGSGQTGNQLDVSGAPANVTGWLKAGDYIQLGSGGTARLHCVLEDVNTTGAGTAMLTVWPDLRSSPLNASTVTIDNPVGLFRLKPQSVDFSRVPLFTTLTLEAMEALNGL